MKFFSVGSKHLPAGSHECSPWLQPPFSVGKPLGCPAVLPERATVQPTMSHVLLMQPDALRESERLDLLVTAARFCTTVQCLKKVLQHVHNEPQSPDEDRHLHVIAVLE